MPHGPRCSRFLSSVSPRQHWWIFVEALVNFAVHYTLPYKLDGGIAECCASGSTWKPEQTSISRHSRPGVGQVEQRITKALSRMFGLSMNALLSKGENNVKEACSAEDQGKLAEDWNYRSQKNRKGSGG